MAGTAEIILKAMADNTRQRMLKVLRGQELNVSELVEVLDQPQSTVSRHLRTLREAGLIRDRREGNTSYYTVREPDDASNGNGLALKLFSWLDEQEMSPVLKHRLEMVLERRRQQSDRFFDRVGRHWDHLREENFGATFHLEAMLSLLPSNWTVADIGAGTGYLLPTLAKQFDRVIGVEPSERMLEIARHRLQVHGLQVHGLQVHALPNAEIRQGDLAALPLDDAEVDLVIAMLVLHHVPAPAEAIANLARVLKPDGRLLIVEQARHGNAEFRDRMQDHWVGFEPRALADWLAAAGFHTQHVTDVTSSSKPADAPRLFATVATKQADQTHATNEMPGYFRLS